MGEMIERVARAIAQAWDGDFEASTLPPSPHQFRMARAAIEAMREFGYSIQMARLSASEYACYHWPEDTPEHLALRRAFMDGAAHVAAQNDDPAESGSQIDTKTI